MRFYISMSEINYFTYFFLHELFTLISRIVFRLFYIYFAFPALFKQSASSAIHHLIQENFKFQSGSFKVHILHNDIKTCPLKLFFFNCELRQDLRKFDYSIYYIVL